MVLQDNSSEPLPTSGRKSHQAQGYNKYKDKFNLCKYSSKSTGKARETVLDRLEKGLTIGSKDGATSPTNDAKDIFSFNGDTGNNNNTQKTEDREIILQMFKDNDGEEVFPGVQGSIDADLNRKKDLAEQPSLARQHQSYTTHLRWGWPNPNLIHRLGLYSGLSSSLYSLPEQLKFENVGESGYTTQCSTGSSNGYLSLTPSQHQNCLSSRPLKPRVMDSSSHPTGRSRHKSGPHIEDGNDDNYQLCKDEKMAREAGVTLSIQDIIQLPMDEFNDLLARHELTEDQLNMCRDIRRRGKNKVAAQNCRKRKIDQIDELQEKLHDAKQQKGALWQEHERLASVMREEAEKLNNLISKILMTQNLSSEHYTIKVTQNEKVQIVNKFCVENSSNGQNDSSLMQKSGSGSNEEVAINVGVVAGDLNCDPSDRDLNPISGNMPLLAMEEGEYRGRNSEENGGRNQGEIYGNRNNCLTVAGSNHGVVDGGRNHGATDVGRNHGSSNEDMNQRTMDEGKSYEIMNRDKNHGPMDRGRNYEVIDGGSNHKAMAGIQNLGTMNSDKNYEAGNRSKNYKTINGVRNHETMNSVRNHGAIVEGSNYEANDGDINHGAMNKGGTYGAIDGGRNLGAIDGGRNQRAIDGGRNLGEMYGGRNLGNIDGGRNITAIDGVRSHESIDGGTNHEAIDGGRTHGAEDGGRNHGAVNEARNHRAIDEDRNHEAIDGGRSHGAVGGGSNHGALNEARNHGVMEGYGNHGAIDGGRIHVPVDGGRNHGPMDGGRNNGVIDGGRNHGAMDGGRKRGTMDGGGNHRAMDEGNDEAMDGGRNHRTMGGSRNRGVIEGCGNYGGMDGGRNHRSMDGLRNHRVLGEERNHCPMRNHGDDLRNRGTIDHGSAMNHGTIGHGMNQETMEHETITLSR